MAVDFVGRSLAVGDRVVITPPGSRQLFYGTIEEISKSGLTAHIRIGTNLYPNQRTNRCCVKVV